MTDLHDSPPPGQPMEPFRPVEPEPFTPAFEAPIARTVRAPGGTAASSTRLMNMALAVAVLVAAIGISFGVGRVTSPATTPAASAAPLGGGGQPGGNGQPGGGVGANPSFDLNGNGNGQPGGEPGDDNGFEHGFGRGPGGLSVAGTVVAITATSITFSLDNGQTVTLPLDANTTYNRQTPASASDVTAGKKVLVQITGRFGGGDDDEDGGSPSVGSITLVP